MARALIALLYRCFGAVDCVEGLEQRLDESIRLVEAVAPVCEPRALARIIANLEIWAVRAVTERECWDYRDQGLGAWLATRPFARMWISGEEFPRAPIAEWLMDELSADDHE